MIADTVTRSTLLSTTATQEATFMAIPRDCVLLQVAFSGFIQYTVPAAGSSAQAQVNLTNELFASETETELLIAEIHESMSYLAQDATGVAFCVSQLSHIVPCYRRFRSGQKLYFVAAADANTTITIRFTLTFAYEQ